jgi:hypothetical protein
MGKWVNSLHARRLTNERVKRCRARKRQSVTLKCGDAIIKMSMNEFDEFNRRMSMLPCLSLVGIDGEWKLVSVGGCKWP